MATKSAKSVLLKLNGPLNFGKILEADRKCAELTQTELAKKAGVSRQMISQIESGKETPSLSLAKILADIFEMDVSIYVKFALEIQIEKAGIDNIEVIVKNKTSA